MQSVNTQTQYLAPNSHPDSNHSLKPSQITNNKTEPIQPIQLPRRTATASLEKQPSKLGLLILALATIALYSLGLNELSKTVTGIVEAAVQATLQNYSI